MRLLAHGGISYTERCRLGAWPEILRGPLEDKHGLSSDNLGVGVGARDESPFLIARQRQKGSAGRLYAFTLLLDPGAEIWAKYEWNAAWLAWTLFDAPDGAGRQLLREPEYFTLPRLATLLQETPPRPLPDAAAGNNRFGAVIAGSSLADEAQAVGFSALGWQDAPALADLAQAVAAAPLFARCGAGWLANGSLRHAPVFGVRLVADAWQEPSAPNHETAAQLRQSGAAWLAARAQVLAADDFRPLLEAQEQRHTWRWTETERATSRVWATQLPYLAEALQAPPMDDEAWQQRVAAAPRDGPLAREIQRAWTHYLAQGSGTLSPARTRYLLRAWCEDLPFPPSAAGRLNRTEYIAFLSQTVIPPDQANLPQQLAPRDRAKVWRKLMLDTATPAAIPLQLVNAIKDLSADPTLCREELEALAAEAVRRTIESGEGLAAWGVYLAHPVAGPLLAAPLRQQAITQARQGTPGWEQDYFIFGQDPGGVALNSLGRFASQEMSGLVTALESWLRTGGTEAREWFACLGASPLRGRLKWRDKWELVCAFAPSATQWAGLAELVNIWRGYTPAGPCRPEEQGFLHGELAALLDDPPQTDFAPDEAVLKDFLGFLPQPLARGLASLHQKLEEVVRRRYRNAGLRHTELLPYILANTQLIPFDECLHNYSEVNRNEFGADVWHALAQRPGEPQRARLWRVCHVLHANPQWHDVLARGWLNLILRKQMNHLSQWLADYPEEVPDDLINCLRPEHQFEILSQVKRELGGAFRQQVSRLYRQCQSDGLATGWRLAVWRYLLTPEGNPVRQLLNNELYGHNNPGQVTEDLHSWLFSATAPVLERGV